MRTKIRACTQCPLACRQVHDFDDYVCEGPEFETLGLCGSNCGVGDLAAVAAFNRECDELGLDTMSTGAVVALAMDLCEAGAADYGLAFGDAAGYLAAPELIARREDWGAELALGARDLAALKGRPDLAHEVKGLELPAYDPRGTFGMGLGYATSDRGACHMRAFTAGDDILGGEAPADSLEGKPALTVEQQDFSALAWTGVWCANMALDTDFLGVHFRHLWGRETSHEELMAIGARIWNLGRLLNLREGFSREQDRLPAILSVPHPGRRGGRQDARRRRVPGGAGRVLPAARVGRRRRPHRGDTGEAVGRRPALAAAAGRPDECTEKAEGRRDVGRRGDPPARRHSGRAGSDPVPGDQTMLAVVTTGNGGLDRLDYPRSAPAASRPT